MAVTKKASGRWWSRLHFLVRFAGLTGLLALGAGLGLARQPRTGHFRAQVHGSTMSYCFGAAGWVAGAGAVGWAAGAGAVGWVAWTLVFRPAIACCRCSGVIACHFALA